MTGSGLSIRQLELADMDARRASIARRSTSIALAYWLHTPDEDRWFYRERVFTISARGFEGGALAAISLEADRS